MQLEREIEFKTEINEREYNALIKQFNLQNNIYKLTNHYFETATKTLKKEGKTLRIRVKDDEEYQLTLKSSKRNIANEAHFTLKKDEAIKMILEGFNLKHLFDKDINVYPYGKLTTYRCQMPYKDGELFFDKIEYYGITKYEIEYEAKYYGLGYKIFMNFLKEHNIKYISTIKKSGRVFNYLERNQTK
ncbi:MAG TPA: CYTH domain-containing protein [Acholeplasma sp.]|jgi:uncharacterized protein YjbK|nr:CYTH domain-containing protein [Acholeplasmatales bacterium]HHV33339.1 CYTH domain-containing protein [Acholeplasma sp.]